MEEKSGHPIIVIGASAGGVSALTHLVKQRLLISRLHALSVLQTSPKGPGLLSGLLEHGAALSVRIYNHRQQLPYVGLLMRTQFLAARQPIAVWHRHLHEHCYSFV